MSLAVTHFAFGAAMTTGLVWTVAPKYPHRMTAAVLGGLWALVPDLHYILPPGYTGAARSIKESVFGDLFWFHATMDGLVQGEGTREGAAIALGFLLVVVAVSEWLDHPVEVVDVDDQSKESTDT